MGQIANAAALNLVHQIANKGQSSTIPMSIDYNIRKSQRKSAKSIGKDTGIKDDENDWLARQLKEEDEVLRRMEEEWGLKRIRRDRIIEERLN